MEVATTYQRLFLDATDLLDELLMEHPTILADYEEEIEELKKV